MLATYDANSRLIGKVTMQEELGQEGEGGVGVRRLDGITAQWAGFGPVRR